MAQPFPDMPYWGTFPANGPIPQGKASDPKTYKNHPLVDRSLHDQEYSPAKELMLVKNPNWDPNTDPARTQYPDGYDFKIAAAVGEDRPDPARRLRHRPDHADLRRPAGS